MMRLSREKIVRLSHQITDVLGASDEVEFIDDRDTIRQQIVQIMTAMLRDEEKIELEVRKRITSQKKEILEDALSFQGDLVHLLLDVHKGCRVVLFIADHQGDVDPMQPLDGAQIVFHEKLLGRRHDVVQDPLDGFVK